ncbi:MAG TPA: glycosyltransferase family 39 protein [Pyrinomonadaceae bacterium]|jgi:4-amino-4-deoxy-L-arabinose transferase-like glycosyltransferase
MTLPARRLAQKLSGNYKRLLLVLAAIILLYAFYIAGIRKNPPGFYLDESSIAYNAYLMGRTGVSESGVAWPLYIRSYTGLFSVYANPIYIYLLAAVYVFSPPSILAARLLSATLGFVAALCLGFLAWRISRRRTIGFIVMLFAMLTPWLFEISRLVFEVALYPLTLALFLLALYRAQEKERWSWMDCALVAASLGLVTYTYTIGRLFAPLLALGLLIFARNRERLIDVFKTWLLFGITLLPLLIFNRRHPGVLTERFYLISYIKPKSTWSEIIPEFISHYFDNLSLSSLLLIGDTNPRHHVAGMGSFLAPVFILASFGIYLVLKYHWRESWWRFILYGLVISPISASLTLDQFHTLRMIPYPVFLLVLTVPALQRLLEGKAPVNASPKTTKKKKRKTEQRPEPKETAFSFFAHRKALTVLLALTLLQGLYFQYQFHRDGTNRGAVFDEGYLELYQQALSQPARPIYLFDGMWGPAYIHAFWYATIDGRGTSDFVHLDYGQRPPSGALVISSEDKCTNCQIILRREQYLLYRAF